MLSASANYFIVRRYGARRTSKKNVRKLQLVQNYACRIAAGLRKYDHVSEVLKSLKRLNVRDRLLFNDLVMVLTPNTWLPSRTLSISCKNKPKRH